MKRIILLLDLFLIISLFIGCASNNTHSNSKTQKQTIEEKSNDNTVSTKKLVESPNPSPKSNKTKTNEADNSIKYTINKKTKKLYISGKGPIYQCNWVKLSSTGKNFVFPVSIIIGSGATLIGDYAFDNGSDGLSVGGRNGLDKVKEVTIPNTVTQIGNEAFHNLISLNSVTIPNSVTWIGEGVFSECISLKKVKLSSNLEELPKKLFYYCKSLKEITIPLSVKTIADDAFLFTDNIIIKGYKGTAAEKYAKKNKFKFVALD